jgi:hypothetical protein
VIISFGAFISPFAPQLNAQDNLKVIAIEMATITLHFIDNDFRQLWISEHTLHVDCAQPSV